MSYVRGGCGTHNSKARTSINGYLYIMSLLFDVNIAYFNFSILSLGSVEYYNMLVVENESKEIVDIDDLKQGVIEDVYPHLYKLLQ